MFVAFENKKQFYIFLQLSAFKNFVLKNDGIVHDQIFTPFFIYTIV